MRINFDNIAYRDVLCGVVQWAAVLLLDLPKHTFSLVIVIHKLHYVQFYKTDSLMNHKSHIKANSVNSSHVVDALNNVLVSGLPVCIN